MYIYDNLNLVAIEYFCKNAIKTLQTAIEIFKKLLIICKFLHMKVAPEEKSSGKHSCAVRGHDAVGMRANGSRGLTPRNPSTEPRSMKHSREILRYHRYQITCSDENICTNTYATEASSRI